jgi:branched-chain amino acid transport system permease protein
MNSARVGQYALALGALLCALSGPAFLGSEYHIHILTMAFINVLIASGLRVIMTTGLVSFCHAAFVAIGGYASALCVMKLGLSSWLGLLLAIMVAVIIAVAFGSILLRLKGTYFFIATTAFGEIVLLTFTRFTEPFGGAAGITNIPLPSPIHLAGMFTISFGSKTSFYYYALGITLFLLLIVYRLDRGRMGAIWTGIQQAEPLAQSVGINVMLYKTVAFSVGCAMAAAAGAFQAHYYSHINPGGFGFFALVNYLVFVIIGGSNRFSGPLVGAILLTLFSEFLSLYEQYAIYQTIVYGIVLILVVMFLPQGVVSLPGRVSSWCRRVADRGISPR